MSHMIRAVDGRTLTVIATGCELPAYNASSEAITTVLEKSKTVAVVGLSPKPERDSHKVARYLQKNGYVIVPVNPGQKEILEERCYRDLRQIPFPVDMIDIFRKSEAVPSIVDDAIAIGAKVVWMQLGIVHNEASEKARQAGLEVIMNKCIKTEHMKLMQQRAAAGHDKKGRKAHEKEHPMPVKDKEDEKMIRLVKETAAKYKATINKIDLKNQVLDIECPDENKAECAVAIQKLLERL